MKRLQSGLTGIVIAGAALAGCWATGRATSAADDEFQPIVEAPMPAGFPEYTPVGQIEVKPYPTYRMAKADGGSSFWTLFSHIKKNKIAMTAPVKQEVSSEKIAMTAPVNQEVTDGTWRITFVMPSKYTLETLPEPLDTRVVLKEMPGRLFAVLKYSGTWSQKRYEEKKAQLEMFIQQRGFQSVGEPIFARYDPPFKPWFLRRNDVLIPIEQSA